MGEYFGDVLKRALSRREVLKSAIFGSAGLALVACGGGGGSLAEATQPPLSFKTIYPNTEDKITVPEGYKHNVVIRWGDALDSGPNLNWDSIYQNGPTDQDIERQKLAEAAQILATQPIAIQLRYLETIQSVANKPGNTVLIPIPTELFRVFFGEGKG